MAARKVSLATAAKRFRAQHAAEPWFLDVEPCPDLVPPCLLVKVQRAARGLPHEWLGHPVALVTYFYGGIGSSRVDPPPMDDRLAGSVAALRVTLDEASRVLDRMLLEGPPDLARHLPDLRRHLDDLAAAAGAASELARSLDPGPPSGT
jgi:hypothetical protein